jgi:glycine hydroxymethyltransferase
MLDWKVAGRDYAEMMTRAAKRLARELHARSIPVFGEAFGFTESHQLAVVAARYGGGQQASHRLRESNLLTCGIGLPLPPFAGDLNGIRIGTPEIVRIGMTEHDMPRLAGLVADALGGVDVSRDVSAWRSSLTRVHYVASAQARTTRIA